MGKYCSFLLFFLLMAGMTLAVLAAEPANVPADPLSPKIARETVEKLYADGLELYQDLQNEEAMQRGFLLFQTASANGSADALNAVGVAQLFGFGTEMDFQAGQSNVDRAVKLGSQKALYNLSSMLFLELFKKRDIPEGMKALELAARGGDVASQYSLGRRYVSPELWNPDKALGWFADAAEHGDKKAKAFTAYLRLLKGGTAGDSNAWKSLQELSKSRVWMADLLLGTYYGGDLTSPHADGLAALEHYQSAYEEERAEYSYKSDTLPKVTLLVQEISRGKDGKLAGQIKERLQQQQVTNCLANYLLGEIYTFHESRYRDEEKAKNFYLQGVKLGCTLSAIKLGDMYMKDGETEMISAAAALNYYELAARDSGEAQAKAALILNSLAKTAEQHQAVYKLGIRAINLGYEKAGILLSGMVNAGQVEEKEPKSKAYAFALLAAGDNDALRVGVESAAKKLLTPEQMVEGVKYSEFFKVLVRKYLLVRGEKSFRF